MASVREKGAACRCIKAIGSDIAVRPGDDNAAAL
jgi:hypothetical protein